MPNPDTQGLAPGAPGMEPRWTSGAKTAVGRALAPESPLWFTIGQGIINEVFYPQPDAACIRDLGLLVTGPDGYFSEEKMDTDQVVEWIAPGIPAFRLVNENKRYRVVKQVVSDPHRPVLLQQIEFAALDSRNYRLYALLAPHLVNAGARNTAWIERDDTGVALMAHGDGTWLAMACSAGWGDCSAGYVGMSDGWQLLSRTGRLDTAFTHAVDGNVALTGEIPHSALGGKVVLALAFGESADAARKLAIESLAGGFDAALVAYQAGWTAWHETLQKLDAEQSDPGRYRASAAVLRVNATASPPGAVVASLSIPWGEAKGDDDRGGYHLVWPRDLVETAGGFLAAGDRTRAREILDYLAAIQDQDGHWAQNNWIDGRPYWSGVQMDETGFPLLLLSMLVGEGAVSHRDLAGYRTMVERAARYIAVNGPVTGEDRWEEDPGLSPFTLAVEIAALLAAADLLGQLGDSSLPAALRAVADCWNEQIEAWCYVTGTELARSANAEGYYVRIAPPDVAETGKVKDGFVPIKNRPPGESSLPARQVISPDALALVRFGLRSAHFPAIIETLKVIDRHISCDLPQGRLWYRYNDDGYGEHDNGAPFNGTGSGRAWPLLVGERAHYEIAAGRSEKAQQMLETFENSAGPAGMLPEQSWDANDIPAHRLYKGRPTGSAMPLVWAHAEHIKLLRSLKDGAVFDLPRQAANRYLGATVVSPLRLWRMNAKLRSIPAGKVLRIELPEPLGIVWSADDWKTSIKADCAASPLGLFGVDLATGSLPSGSRILFRIERQPGDADQDFTVAVE